MLAFVYDLLKTHVFDPTTIFLPDYPEIKYVDVQNCYTGMSRYFKILFWFKTIKKGKNINIKIIS